MKRHGTILAFAVGWYLVQCLSVMNDAPPASPDAAVFADASRNLLATGHLRTNLVTEMANHMYWQPPGYPLALAVMFKLFGFGLWQLRLLSLVFGAACLWMVYEVTSKIRADSFPAVIAVLILAFDPLFAKWARWDRMDPICMFFVLLSLYMYLSALGNSRRFFFFGAGAFASAATMIHPCGAISFALIGLHAAFVRRPSIREILGFAFPVILLFGGWAVYIAQAPGEFLVQMHYQFSRKFLQASTFPREVLLQYRFFPSYVVIVAGALASAYACFKKPAEPRDRMIGIAVLIVLCLYVVVKSPYYHTYLAPVFAIAASTFLANRLQSETQETRRLTSLLLALVALNGMAYSGAITWLYRLQLRQDANHEVLVRQILQYLPTDARFGHVGYPTPYWVLYGFQQNDRMREIYVFRPELAARLFDGLDYLVFTQSSNAIADDRATRRDVDFASMVLGREGRRLRFVTIVGSDATNAYRALIYLIESEYNFAGTGENAPRSPRGSGLSARGRESLQGHDHADRIALAIDRQ